MTWRAWRAGWWSPAAWCGSLPAALRARQPVRTASLTQVLRPVYRPSITCWNNDPPAVAVLFAALADDLRRRALTEETSAGCGGQKRIPAMDPLIYA
jgi:hypothetical protein